MYNNIKIPFYTLFTLFCITQILAWQFSTEDLDKIRQYRFGDDQTTLVFVEQSLARADVADRKVMLKQLTGILESKADYAAKQFVCRQMARFGDVETVSILAQMLSDESLADMARYALGRIPHGKVDQLLYEALDDASDKVKLGLISTIGERGVTKTLDKLEALLYDDNAQIVNSAATALGKIASEKAAISLLTALRSSNSTNYPHIADALLSCANAFVSSGNKEGAIPIYQELFDRSSQPQIRAAALKGLQMSEADNAFELVLKSLEDKNSLVSGGAARLTLTFPGEEYTQKIIKQFPDLNQKAKVQLLYALKDRGDSSALATVEAACDNRSEEVRSAALIALASLGDASHLSLLVDRAAHTSGREQLAAKQALLEIEIADLPSQAKSLFEKTRHSEKLIVLDLVSHRGIHAVIENVFLLTEDEDQQVRQASFMAIGQMAEEEHMNRVVSIWERSGADDQRFTEDMMVRYGKKLGRDDQPVVYADVQPDWLHKGFGIKSYGHDENFTNTLLDRADADYLKKEKISSLIRIFGRIGDDRSLPYLESQLNNEDDIIIAENIRALSSWPNGKPLEYLWQVVTHSQNETNKILALRGFIALTPYQPEETIKNYNQALKVASDAEKRKILGQLGQMKTFAAFDLAARYIENKSLQQEAAQAAINISHRVYQNHLDSVEEVMHYILSLYLSQDIDAKARNVLEKILMARDIAIKDIGKSLRFRKHVINQESAFEAATFMDVNNDGQLDLFCGGFWYQAPDWQKHFVRNVPEQDEYYFDFGAIPMDVDGDGWTDVVNGSWHGKDVFWLHNPGISGQEFRMVPIDNPGNLETLIAVDLSGDNRMDVLPNTVSALVWYEYDKELPGRWKKHEQQKEAAGHGVGAGDVNNDGLNDIVTPKGWLQQPSDYNQEWTWYREFKLDRTSVPILVHDIDGDSDSDLIWGDGHGYGVFWLEQTVSDEGDRKWIRHTIDMEWSQSHFLLLADLDADGTKELVTGKRVRAHNGHDPGGYDPPCVYYYKFNKNENEWDRYVISERENIGFGIYTSAQDYDGDGDVDILAPGKSGLYLFENLYIE